MFDLFFYLEKWFFPMVMVALIYLAFLVPTYFFVKKYKPSYWLMMGLSVLVVYLVDAGLFLLLNQDSFSSGGFLFRVFFVSVPFSFLLLVVLPLIFKVIFKKFELTIKFIFSYYLLVFFSFSSYVYIILYVIFSNSLL